MRRTGKFLGRVIIVIALLGAALWAFGPREPVDLEISFDPNALGDDLDAYLQDQEARFDDITPGAEKRIDWAGEAGEKTPLAIVYLHGWSATAPEISPVPENAAKAVGANAFFTRLSGHGRSGAALAEATAGDWLEDVAEAMEIGRRIGERVVLIGTSTGGTLAAEIAADPALSENLAGIAFVSPNFAVNSPIAFVMTMPFARQLVPMLAGETRSWEAQNELHEKFWTTSYPSVAVLPMGALVKHANTLDFAGISTPALFVFTMNDTVVDHRATVEVIEQWGGSTLVVNPSIPPEEGSEDSHVLAGDIVSPQRTTSVSKTLIDWISGL